MLNNIRIQNKLFAGFAAIIALVVLLLWLTYAALQSLVDANRWDRHTAEVLLSVTALDNNLLETRARLRTFWYSGASADADTARQALTSLTAAVRVPQQLTQDNASQQQRFARLSADLDNWRQNTFEPLLRLRETGNLSPAQLANEPLVTALSTQVTNLRQQIQGIGDEERRLSAQRAGHTEEVRDQLTWTLVAGGTFCVLLAALIAWLLSHHLLRSIRRLTDTVARISAGDSGARVQVLGRDELAQVGLAFNQMAQQIQDDHAREQALMHRLRADVDDLLGVVNRAAAGDLTGRTSVTGDDAIGQLARGLSKMIEDLRGMIAKVQRAGIQVTSSTTEIAASSRQQEATSIEQAQTSVEVLSTTREIAANANALVRTMEEAVQVADETTQGAEQARSSLASMDGTMQRMVAATDSINAKLAALSEKSSHINKVLTTITKVADQTNLLSLNAAIEAEKAGEAGRGFSVVATEIRRLSDQTTAATDDIEQMLKDMNSAVSASVMGMDKFSEEIRRSVQEVASVSDQLAEVIEDVQKLPARFDIVLEGMQSQAVGAGQIAETITQLNDSTQQTTEALKATSEAVQYLQQAAQDLQSSVATFSVTR
ncbi:MULTISPECIES: methyl-accepting chemotaxis protein [Pseudomonadaceae]|uniref:Chemotaxis protein n=2 Tax=Pseudomonas TaxID=286 RepID=A0A1G5MDB1_9PSED|nr:MULTISPECIES: methyl-accepting chemotaxis protein [Pseudomonas]KIZ52597.1 chemotaxis protein [Pseudomonas oryzihabitans]MBA1257094.1 HAMP domain-containing protein [Pseudomonas psychrotolerans]MDU4055656.1 methyl-accepting chemotaxis protein [Pseudomonas oryzihabitans]NMY88425.1 HAMP domain-containing protein [Pseudomonas psychrotolerans]NMZ44010.1 HAMP domain-containing protein [Pseudomonas oryzihabitans]